jgi:hypothetical protein
LKNINANDDNVNRHLHLNVDRDDVEEQIKQIKNTSQQETKRHLHLNVDGDDVEEKIEQQEIDPSIGMHIS